MIDMTDYYGNAAGLADELAGPPPSKPKAQASALRKPVKQSTSLTNAVEATTPGDPLQDRLTKLGGEREALLAEQEKAYAKPDYSGYQQHGQQQQESGQRALMLALAAQEAGQEFQPVQAHYLKRAAAAREPMKVTGGTITDTGFVEDVGHTQELQARRLDARIKQIDGLMQATITAQERSQLAREKIEAQRELRMLSASIAQAGRAGVQQDRIFRGEDRMKNDFEQITKSAREGLQASQQVKPLLAGAVGRKTTNVEQQALITLFNKFLDPTSVVREGEFDRMAKGMGLGQRVQNWSDKILSGSIITPEMVNEIGRVAQIYEGDALRRIQEQSAEYERIAQQRQYDPNAIITNPAWRAQQPGGASGPPQGAVRVKGAPAPAAAPPAVAGPPPGAVRVKQ